MSQTKAQLVDAVDGSIVANDLASNSVTTAKVADDAITLAKLSATGTASSSTFLRGDNTFAAAGGATGWTHVNYTSIGTGGSYTFSGIPTNAIAFRINFIGLSSNTGSGGSESYTGFRLGTASGLIDDNYNSMVGYLETSYQRVNAWTSRHMLYNENYGTSGQSFNGQIQCWKTAGTDRWNIMSDVTRGNNGTYFWGQAYINLGANITQAQLFLNTGSFDGGSASLSYYQD
tara:strand:- start:861 stop:1553 length:693 start_codon:yes stop_codon:yes gene_type:complete